MPRKKKSEKEEREEKRKSRLVAIVEESTQPFIDESVYSGEPTQEDVREASKKIRYLKSENLADDQFIFKQEKSELQRELDSFVDPVILDLPEFLLDPELSEERKRILKELYDLVKNRSYSLVSVADILQTNDYSNLEKLVERKNKIREYNTEKKDSRYKIFSDFKKVVTSGGDENCPIIYAEQESRMKAAIEILMNGIYFKELAVEQIKEQILKDAKKAKLTPEEIKQKISEVEIALEMLKQEEMIEQKMQELDQVDIETQLEELLVEKIKEMFIKDDEEAKLTPEEIEQKISEVKIISEKIKQKIQELDKEDIEKKIEDIVGDVIDNQDFNRACQIEIEYLNYEYNYLENLAAELQSRVELQELLDSLREISGITEERAHKYSIMDKLLTGKDRKVINITADKTSSAGEGER